MNNLIMSIIEIDAEKNYGYHDFFLEGLIRHGNYFKITPDELRAEPFPTKGTKDSFTLAAIGSGKLMGVTSFQPVMNNRIKLAHKGELVRMYVSEEHTGKNVGANLMAHLIERVKNDLPHIEQINLNVLTKNEKAKNLYRKFGFEHFGTERNALKSADGYFDDDYMALKIRV